MNHAIAELEKMLDVVQTNEPIHRAVGDIQQADFELVCAEQYKKAIDVLSAL